MNKKNAMNEEEVSDFELLQGKVQGLYEEVLALSKKSPSDVLNKFKLRLTNGIIRSTNAFFVQQSMNLPVDGFDQFEDEEIPSNSDVLIVLSQYLQCLEKLRADNIKLHSGRWYWVIDGKESSRHTAAPRKIRE